MTTNAQRELLKDISQSSQGVVTGIKFIAVQGSKEEPVDITYQQLLAFIQENSSNTLNDVLTAGNTSALGAVVGSINVGTPPTSALFSYVSSALKIYDANQAASFFLDIGNGFLQFQVDDGDTGTLAIGGITANRQWAMPDASGTVALGTSGVYAPTTTNITNVLNSAALGSSFYTRIGNIVTGSVTLNVEPTIPGACQVDFSLPVASNFADITDLKGIGSGPDGTNAFTNIYAIADVANNRASLFLVGVGGGSSVEVTFQYQILT